MFFFYVFFYENRFFLRCEVWDEVVEQKGALPPSKSSIGSKKSAPKKNMKTPFLIVFYFFLFFVIVYCFLIIFFKINI